MTDESRKKIELKTNLSFTPTEAVLGGLIVLFASQILGGIISTAGYAEPVLNHFTIPFGWFAGMALAIFLLLVWKNIPTQELSKFFRKKWNFLQLSTSVLLFLVMLPMVEFATTLIPTSGLNGVIDQVYKVFTDAFLQLFEYKIAAIFTVCVLAPVIEELIFRGILLKGMLNAKVSPVLAIVVSSLLFGFIHLNPWQFVGASLLGGCLAFVYYRTNNLWYCIILHAINNIISSVFFFVNGETMDMENLSMYGSDSIYVIGSLVLTMIVGRVLYIQTQSKA